MSARSILRALVNHTPVLRVYARARRLSLVTASQERAIAYFEQRTADLEAQVVDKERLVARVDELEAEVRELWQRRAAEDPLEVFLPVRKEDLLAAERRAQGSRTARGPSTRYSLDWVITPPATRTSGGHVDIFRAIAFLESQGHVSRVYFYDPPGTHAGEPLDELLDGYSAVAAELYPDTRSMAPCDAIIATGWTTAYPVRAFGDAAQKIYFVQDYEPFFVAPGTYSALAANTYGFGFHGITLGDWLAEKLQREHGMACDSFPFGVDTSQYKLGGSGARPDRVLFYARPSSERRGFELGILALELFHTLHPDYEIVLIGEEIDRWRLPFPCIRRGVLAPDQLAELYNTCAAALVLSFTNMSLVPLELLACGCLPVVNDGANTRAVAFAADLHYAAPNPHALAHALEVTSLAARQWDTVAACAGRASEFDWRLANQRIEELLRDRLGVGA